MGERPLKRAGPFKVQVLIPSVSCAKDQGTAGCADPASDPAGLWRSLGEPASFRDNSGLHPVLATMAPAVGSTGRERSRALQSVIHYPCLPWAQAGRAGAWGSLFNHPRSSFALRVEKR